MSRPLLTIRSEHLGHELVGSLGFDDIDFESEEFSRRFWVKTAPPSRRELPVSPGIIALLLAAAVVLVWAIATANRFVRLRQHLRESWSDIDVELKRRHDLVPDLVATVRGYTDHERGLLERVVELRNRAAAGRGSPSARGRDETALLLGLERVFALAEDHPELRSDRNFLELQRQLALTEDRIAAARRFFNGNARTLNALRESVPSNLVARLMEVEPVEFFELDDRAERVVPRMEPKG